MIFVLIATRAPAGGRRSQNPVGGREPHFSGADGVGATPVPIPNTAVKPHCGDGTARETVRESSTAPDFDLAPRPLAGGRFRIRVRRARAFP